IQMRYASPFDNDPRSLAALRADQESLMLRRTRTALEGHLLEENLTYKMQYDWSSNVLRDFSINLGWSPSAQLWLGRGKVMYNDERWTSSSRQQFVNRSIVNDLFTVDRQQGAQLHGRLFAGTPTDFNYMVGLFTGRGISERSNDDDRLMYATRLQWNALGEPMSRAQSDLAFTPRPNLNVAIAGMRNRSNCTTFATELNACRALPRFTSPENAQAGQFELEQAMAELRFRWNGFSLQGEVHRKEVIDRTLALSDPRRETTLLGGYIQAGLLPHGLFADLPPQLEFAMRYAAIDPDDFRGNDTMEELTGVANWYLDGHENKVSLEFGRLRVADPILQEEGSENRIRLQWDIRF
ncbi:MAG: porin, partial [Chromatocurvus sp.]